MPAMSEFKSGSKKGILRAKLDVRGIGAMDGLRAELEFVGVDHGGPSYEVRVFFENPKADQNTPRAPELGYAGRFVVFGHGGCYGGVGHCDPSAKRRGIIDLRPGHALAPQTKIVVVSRSLQRVAAAHPAGAFALTVTLVPVARDHGPYALVKDRMKFSTLRLKVHDDSLGMPYGAVREPPPSPPMPPPAPPAPPKRAAKSAAVKTSSKKTAPKKTAPKKKTASKK